MIELLFHFLKKKKNSDILNSFVINIWSCQWGRYYKVIKINL